MATIGISPANLTLEGFFLMDYERLRQENEELKTKLGAAAPSGFGVFDLGHPSDMVRVTVAGYSNYTDKKGITSEVLREALEMSDEELWEWGCKTYPHKERWYGDLRPVRVEYHKFQYTLRIVETRHDRTFVTDGTDENEDASRLFLVRDWEGEECLECWQEVSRLDYVKRQALEELRDEIRSAIPRVEKQEQES